MVEYESSNKVRGKDDFFTLELRAVGGNENALGNPRVELHRLDLSNPEDWGGGSFNDGVLVTGSVEFEVPRYYSAEVVGQPTCATDFEIIDGVWDGVGVKGLPNGATDVVRVTPDEEAWWSLYVEKDGKLRPLVVSDCTLRRAIPVRASFTI